MKINYRTYEQLVNDCRNFSKTLPRNFDLIVGIPRSGMIPANIIGFYLNVPVVSIDEFTNGLINGHGERLIGLNKIVKNVLLVDDSSGTGSAMKTALKKCKNYISDKNYNLKNAVLYTHNPKVHIDFIFSDFKPPRLFEWNIFNCLHLTKACVDIDGVICKDPDFVEDDNNFREHVINAKPLYLLGRPALALVTNRLEKYRKETVEWLKKHDVKYKNLIMADYDNVHSRRVAARKIGYGNMKYNHMKRVQAKWFIESSITQAKQIKNNGDFSVFCTENMQML